MNTNRKVFDKLLRPGTWLRKWYELGLTGIHIISNEGWHTFYIKFTQWTREKFIRLRIRYNSACYSRKDRNAIASILQTKFKGKTGIRIGGRLSPEYTTYLSLCEKVIDANIILPGGSAPEEVDYIAEATNLHFAGDGQYDFVCSAHVLEHVANPVKALYEWKRVIKDDGFIYAAIPDKRFTFDNRRKRTTLSHLIQDYNMDVDQNDITHVAELIDKWDQRLDMIFCHSRETWLQHISVDSTSGIHHHAWIKDDVVALFDYVGLTIIYVALSDFTIHIIAEKRAVS